MSCLRSYPLGARIALGLASGAVIVLVVLGSVAALALVSAPGRRLVCDQTSALLSRTFRARIALGECQSLWPWRLHLRDSQVSLDGRTLLALEELKINLRWQALFNRRVEIYSARLNNAHVKLSRSKEGQLNLVSAFTDPSPSPSSGASSSPWRVRIGLIQIRDGAIEDLPTGLGGAEIDLRASFALTPAETAVDLASFRARIVRSTKHIATVDALSTQLAVTEDAILVRGLTLRASHKDNRLRLQVAGAFGAAAPRGHVALSAHAEPEFLRSLGLAPAARLKTPLSLQTKIRARADGLLLRSTLQTHGGALRLEASVGKKGKKGAAGTVATLSTAGLRLDAVVRGLAARRVSGELALSSPSGSLAAWQSLTGRKEVTAELRHATYNAWSLPDLRLRGAVETSCLALDELLVKTLRQRRIGELAARGQWCFADAHSGAHGQAEVEADLELGRFFSRLPSLARSNIPASRRPAAGRVSMQATGELHPNGQFRLSTWGKLRALRLDALRLARARWRLSAEGRPSAPQLEASFGLDGLRVGQHEIRSIELQIQDLTSAQALPIRRAYRVRGELSMAGSLSASWQALVSQKSKGAYASRGHIAVEGLLPDRAARLQWRGLRLGPSGQVAVRNSDLSVGQARLAIADAYWSDAALQLSAQLNLPRLAEMHAVVSQLSQRFDLETLQTQLQSLPSWRDAALQLEVTIPRISLAQDASPAIVPLPLLALLRNERFVLRATAQGVPIHALAGAVGGHGMQHSMHQGMQGQLRAEVMVRGNRKAPRFDAEVVTSRLNAVGPCQSAKAATATLTAKLADETLRLRLETQYGGPRGGNRGDHHAAVELQANATGTLAQWLKRPSAALPALASLHAELGIDALEELPWLCDGSSAVTHRGEGARAQTPETKAHATGTSGSGGRTHARATLARRPLEGSLVIHLKGQRIFSQDPTLELDLYAAALRWGELPKSHLRLHAAADAKGLQATAKIQTQGTKLLQAWTRLPWLVSPHALLPSANGPPSVKLKVARLPVAHIAALSPQLADPEGSVSGFVALRGATPKNTVATPKNTVAGRTGASSAAGAEQWWHSVQARGHLDLRDVSLTLRDPLVRIEHVEGRVRLRNNRLTMERMVFRDRGGKLRLEGQLAFDGWRPAHARAELVASAYPIRRQGLVQAYLDGTIHATANLKGDTRRLRVQTRDLDLRLPEQLPRGIRDLEQHDDVIYATQSGFDRSLSVEQARKAKHRSASSASPAAKEWTVAVASREPVWVRRPDFAAQVTIDLEARGLGAKPRVTGSFVLKRGFINLYGKNFDVKESSIRFAGGHPINPNLEIRARHRLASGSIITVEITGDMRAPTLMLSSDDPALDTETAILAALVSGRRSSGETDRDASEQAKNALASLTAGLLSTVLRRELGQYAPIIQVSSEGELQSTAVSAGLQADELVPEAWRSFIQGAYVEGSLGGTESAQALGVGFLLELYLPRSFTLSSTYEQPDNWSLDLLWRR